MLSFTDYVPWPETRFQIGWYLLYQIYFNIGLNGLLIIYLIIKQIVTNLRRRAIRNRIRAEMKEKQKQA